MCTIELRFPKLKTVNKKAVSFLKEHINKKVVSFLKRAWSGRLPGVLNLRILCTATTADNGKGDVFRHLRIGVFASL